MARSGENVFSKQDFFFFNVGCFAYMYYMCAWCPFGPEESLEPLELELQAGVRCLVGAKNQTQALWKCSYCSSQQGTLT